jgi:hypothetical protein
VRVYNICMIYMWRPPKIGTVAAGARIHHLFFTILLHGVAVHLLEI